MRALVSVILLTLLSTAALAEEVRAFWISPDWLLPGDRRVSHEEARALADRVVRAVKAHGGNAILLETLMRGQLIGPCVRVTRTGQIAPAGAPLFGALASSALPSGAPALAAPLAGAPLAAAPVAAAPLAGAPQPASEDARIQQARDQYRARIASLLEHRTATAAPAAATAPAAAVPVEPSTSARTAGARVAEAEDWLAAAKARLAASRNGTLSPDAASRGALAGAVPPSAPALARFAPAAAPTPATAPARLAPASAAPALTRVAPAAAVVQLSRHDIDGALPVYPLCEWDYAVVDGWPQDLLSLFIEAGKQHGVAIHAWVHCFYWKSDNESFRKPWQDGPSLWDDLMVDYLERASKQVRFLPRQRALAYLASQLAKGFTWNRFIAALDKWGAGGFEGRFQGLIQSIVGADGPAPDFLLTNIRGDLHYPMEMDRILALYLNPADPRVSSRVERVVAQIVASHPGLAGVHLDHVRYQKWPYGGPAELAGFPRELRISYWDIPRSSVSEIWPAMQAKREAAITRMVQNIRSALPAGQRLSAAVYPTYYSSREASALHPEAYICQDWARWPVDYVFPMIYNPSLAYVQNALAGCRSGGAARARGTPPQVYPGVSSLGIARNWRSWAFFDFQGLAGTVQGIPGSAMRTMGLKDKLL